MTLNCLLYFVSMLQGLICEYESLLIRRLIKYQLVPNIIGPTVGFVTTWLIPIMFSDPLMHSLNKKLLSRDNKTLVNFNKAAYSHG